MPIERHLPLTDRGDGVFGDQIGGEESDTRKNLFQRFHEALGAHGFGHIGIGAGPHQGVNLFRVGFTGNNNQAMAQKFGAQLVEGRSTKHAGHVQIDQHHIETAIGTQFIYQAGEEITSLNKRICKVFLIKNARLS